MCELNEWVICCQATKSKCCQSYSPILAAFLFLFFIHVFSHASSFPGLHNGSEFDVTFKINAITQMCSIINANTLSNTGPTRTHTHIHAHTHPAHKIKANLSSLAFYHYLAFICKSNNHRKNTNKWIECNSEQECLRNDCMRNYNGHCVDLWKSLTIIIVHRIILQ